MKKTHEVKKKDKRAKKTEWIAINAGDSRRTGSLNNNNNNNNNNMLVSVELNERRR